MLRRLFVTGMAVGLSQLEGFTFDSSRPHVFCRICGKLFQTDKDRAARSEAELLDALLARRDWSLRHAKIHPDWEHNQLKLSGRFLTPEAANNLAAFGVLDLVGLSIDDEMIDAYAENKSVPTDDAEG